MLRMFLLLGLLAVSAPLLSENHSVSREEKAVLVTGASSGIGRKIAETLAANGFYVYAGARKAADLEALDALPNTTAVRLDVTVQSEIDAAVETIEQQGRGLHGLVNNAGVFIGGPVGAVPVDEFDWLMDVNVYGVYRVTQAFLPMLIESGGHVSTISSISGVNSGRFFSHYSASKHAVEAMADSLAAEVEPLGVTVSLIEPGNYNSSIGETAYRRMLEKDYAKEGSPYYEQYQQLLGWLDSPRERYDDPDDVADAALHALTEKAPLRRYLTVPNEGEARWAIAKALEEVAEYNQWNAFHFSRDELIAMLDESISERPSPRTGPDTADDLASFVNDFLAAADQLDVHERFWADDLVYTSSDGTRFGKADLLNGMQNADDSEDSSAVSYSSRDMRVRTYGTTAVVTFTLVGTRSDGDEMTYFNTGTFRKANGEWRAVAWQATRTAE